MEFTVKKEIIKGEKFYKLLNWKHVYMKEDLPHQYYQGAPYIVTRFENGDGEPMLDVVFNEWDFICFDNELDSDGYPAGNLEVNKKYIKKGAYFSVSNWEKFIKNCKASSAKLQKIENEIRELKEAWKGEETFII